MIEYFKLALSKYAQFTGRSRRSEYWYFTLVNIIISVALNIMATITEMSMFALLGSLVSLALFIPALAVAVRRLHDVGRSGWWYLIIFTGIGIFVILYWFVQDSEAGANQWGPNPKTGAVAGDISSHLVD